MLELKVLEIETANEEDVEKQNERMRKLETLLQAAIRSVDMEVNGETLEECEFGLVLVGFTLVKADDQMGVSPMFFTNFESAPDFVKHVLSAAAQIANGMTRIETDPESLN